MHILINQMSGLGNQLFQFAAGLFYAQRYDASVAILREPKVFAVAHGYPRPFLLSEFAIEIPVRERGLADRLLGFDQVRTKPVADTLRIVTGTRILRESAGSCWHFQPELAIPRGTRRLYLEGYWQVHQIAAQMEPELRRQLVFRNPPEGRTLEVLQRISACPAPVSLHIRRGDYTLAAEGYPALGMTYYRNALGALMERIANPTIFVFSDEIEYARQHLPAVAPPGTELIFVDHNRDATAHDDLRLMAACRHHIIANSSFSWWGAWLNPDPAKLVIAPDRWVDPEIPNQEILPPAWLQVPAGPRAIDEAG
jgi:hypothetical protein